jgi:hypothetical protein
MPYSLSINSHILSSFSIHQQHHCHPSPYCPFFVILITTAGHLLSGTISTEIGKLKALNFMDLCKYDGCLCSFHALYFIYKLTYFAILSPSIALNSPTTHTIVIHRVILITTAGNSLSGTIPKEIGQLTALVTLRLGKYDGMLTFFSCPILHL